MRTALLFLLCFGASLPLQAAPPSAPAPAPTAPATPAASHSRIGELMGSLTRALQEASEQRAHPGKADAASLDTPAKSSPATPATPLPPDATAQAAVP